MIRWLWIIAIPSNLYTAPKVNGLKSIKTTSVTLRPANASSTSEFSYDGNRELVFHVPAYPNSYISPKQTFLSMIVKAIQPDGDPDAKFRFHLGYPVFNRIQIKTSSAVRLSAISTITTFCKNCFPTSTLNLNRTRN